MMDSNRQLIFLSKYTASFKTILYFSTNLIMSHFQISNHVSHVYVHICIPVYMYRYTHVYTKRHFPKVKKAKHI